MSQPASNGKTQAQNSVASSDGLCRRLGMVVRISRNVKGMTLGELSEKSGISKGNLSRWENKGMNVTIETLFRVAAALETTPQKMIDAAA